MPIHPTIERLRALGLTAMADAFIELQNSPEAPDLPGEDWLGLLVDREVTSRENRRLARRLRTPRGLDRALFTRLATCRWIRDHQHVVIVGPTAAQARGEGHLPRLLGTIERTRLLIIDWGPEPLTAEQRRDLLEIVDDRYGKASLLITS